MLESALKCGLAEATVWKVEKNEPVRWETVHLLLVHAFGIRAKTPTYQGLHALWLRGRQERAEHRPEDSGKVKAAEHEIAAVRKFRTAVRGKSEDAVKKAIAAALRALK